MNQSHTLDLTEKVAMRAEKAPNKKSIKWVIIKYLFLILILVVAIFGIYKIFFTDLALERLEADLAASNKTLAEAVDQRNRTRSKLEVQEITVQEEVDNNCKKWLVIKNYKDSKGLPYDKENNQCQTNQGF
jgi:hypothetical protein